MSKAIRWGHTMNSNLQGLGKLIEVRVPIYSVGETEKLIIDAVSYRKQFKEIIIYAQMVETSENPYTPYIPTVPYLYRELK